MRDIRFIDFNDISTYQDDFYSVYVHIFHDCEVVS